MTDREVPLISDEGVTMVPVPEEFLAKLREVYEDVPTFRLVNDAYEDVSAKDLDEREA